MTTDDLLYYLVAAVGEIEAKKMDSGMIPKKPNFQNGISVTHLIEGNRQFTVDGEPFITPQGEHKWLSCG